MTLINFTEPRAPIRQKIKECAKNIFSVKSLKKRVPVLEWGPKYNLTLLAQDAIAGITVGLTGIPQGIAYAIVAGLPPVYGLYSEFIGGFLYLFFGSCKDITIGPTAILAAMIAKYVTDYSSDYAVLAAFLSGWVILLMGVFNLGFLVEFISLPVISGFTTSAALQIAASQVIPLFGMNGSSGNYFGQSIYNISSNIKTFKIPDSTLGIISIILLLALKKLGQGCGRTDNLRRQIRWFISLGRNAIVVIIGILIAYITKIITDTEPLKLIGEISGGLPKLQLPPFSTVVGNETQNFSEMLNTLGPGSIILPLVSILELVAIAKAFARGVQINATQEMIALGICNILGSFVMCMPSTGSFTRTAINNASGVQTPAGGIFKGLLVILALSLLTSTFYYIPKASLAALIITAMFYMIDYKIFLRLRTSSKKELTLLIVTIYVCLFVGLEYGIVAGVILDALMLLFVTARPHVDVSTLTLSTGKVILIILPEYLSYCSADHVKGKILKASSEANSDTLIIIDGINLQNMDTTVASNLISVVNDFEEKGVQILFLNFKTSLKEKCTEINLNLSNKFITVDNRNIEDILAVTSRAV